MLNVLIRTDTRYPVNRKIIRKAVEDTFKKHKFENLTAEVSVSVVGSRKMKSLSQKYLKDSSPHQILTFPFEETGQSRNEPSDVGQAMPAHSSSNFSGSETGRQGFVGSPDDILRLGDVVLCWPQVLREAAKDDIMVDEEVYDLICHGVEHLLGYGHP